MLREALQYQRLCGGRAGPPHEEDPSLSGDGCIHKGEVWAKLGIATMAISGISRVDDVITTKGAGHRRVEGHTAFHIQHLERQAVAAGGGQGREWRGVRIIGQAKQNTT